MPQYCHYVSYCIFISNPLHSTQEWNLLSILIRVGCSLASKHQTRLESRVVFLTFILSNIYKQGWESGPPPKQVPDFRTNLDLGGYSFNIDKCIIFVIGLQTNLTVQCHNGRLQSCPCMLYQSIWHSQIFHPSLTFARGWQITITKKSILEQVPALKKYIRLEWNCVENALVATILVTTVEKYKPLLRSSNKQQ